jgi:predicted nucleic acid-binding Zn ribbon protein
MWTVFDDDVEGNGELMLFPDPMSDERDPKKFRKRNAQLTGASDVLQALLQNSKSQLSDGFRRWRLELDWPEVVGKSISEQTLPVAFEHGILYIWVKHSAWMQQMWFFQENIKDKVNGHVGTNWVKQVRFTLNRRAATTAPENSEG